MSDPNLEDRTATVRAILDEVARLDADVGRLDAGADLFDAGMTSHASVNVMLALEEAFGFEYPDSMLRKSTFASIDAIVAGISVLLDTAGSGP